MNLLKMRLSVLWHQDWMDPAQLAEPRALDRAAYYELMALPRLYHQGPLTAPWPPDKGQGFWERYLAQWRTLDGISRDLAWRSLVPLRSIAEPLRIVTDGDDATATSEGFIHPWGGTVAVHLNLNSEWPDLPAAATRIRELRRDRCFGLAESASERLRLDDLAIQGLDALRGLAAAATPGTVREGFSIFALLAAVGELAEFDPAVEATGAARFLHAVTSFKSTWAADTLGPLDQARAGGKATDPASHLIFGASRARAIWSPVHFLISPQDWEAERNGGSGPRRITVGCHHRNLTLASMQTEALARFASGTAERLEGDFRLANEHGLLARCAVGRLGDLYLGSPKTYRSRSIQVQIDDGQHLADINAIRAEREMPKIG